MGDGQRLQRVRAASERSYPHIAGSVTAHDLRLCQAPGRGRRQRASHGRRGASRVRGRVPGGAGERSGVRDLGDRLTEERYNACGARTPSQLDIFQDRRGGVGSHNSRSTPAEKASELIPGYRGDEINELTCFLSRGYRRGLSTRHKSRAMTTQNKPKYKLSIE